MYMVCISLLFILDIVAFFIIIKKKKKRKSPNPRERKWQTKGWSCGHTATPCIPTLRNQFAERAENLLDVAQEVSVRAVSILSCTGTHTDDLMHSVSSTPGNYEEQSLA